MHHPYMRPFTLQLTSVVKVDEVVNYIDWAVDNKFAVMDVNVPSYEESDNVSGNEVAS